CSRSFRHRRGAPLAAAPLAALASGVRRHRWRAARATFTAPESSDAIKACRKRDPWWHGIPPANAAVERRDNSTPGLFGWDNSTLARGNNEISIEDESVCLRRRHGAAEDATAAIGDQRSFLRPSFFARHALYRHKSAHSGGQAGAQIRARHVTRVRAAAPLRAQSAGLRRGQPRRVGNLRRALPGA